MHATSIWAALIRRISEDDLPLETRIKRMAFSLAMLTILLLGGVLMLFLTLIDIPNSQQQNHLNNVRIIGEALSSDIGNQLNSIRQLSHSSLVWTSLTDSAGREAYLRPFMQDQAKNSGNIPMQLLDYRGRPVLGDIPSTMQTKQLSDLINKVISENRPRFTVIENNSTPLLLALFPIIYPYTQESIGVLVGETDLSELFKKRSSGLGPELGLEMTHQGRKITLHSHGATSIYFPVQFDLGIDADIEGGPLTLRLYATNNPWLIPILERIFISMLLAVLLGGLVWRVSGTIARRISERLNRLAEACISLSDGRAAVIPTDSAKDEIGVLSRTLHQAIDSYEQINSQLEALVERKTRKLSESEARFRSFFENNSSVMLLTDPVSGKIIDANMAASDYYRLGREQLIGVSLGDFNVESADGNKGLLLPSQVMYNKHRIASGEVRDVEIYSTPIESAGHTLLFSIIHDITERKQLEIQVRQLAFNDTLTQLPNRRLLHDRLEQAISANKRSNMCGALMFLDLDNFKPLNDTHGHAVGDRLLILVAERLRSCVREMDTVARLGGDEFVVMLSELDIEKTKSISEAKTVADKILKTLSEPYLLTIHKDGADTVVEHHCSASIGVVVFDNQEFSQDDILKHADFAMYQAKQGGRNAIRFYDSAA